MHKSNFKSVYKHDLADQIQNMLIYGYNYYRGFYSHSPVHEYRVTGYLCENNIYVNMPVKYS